MSQMSKINGMQTYVLGFCIVDEDHNAERERRYWRCQAEDYDHAVEQLMDAEPETYFHELISREL